MKSKIIEDGKRRELLFQQSLAQRETVLVSHPVGDSVAPSEPGSKNGPRTSAGEPFQRAHPPSMQETDHLDEELDILLNLDAPIDAENKPVSGALSYSTSTEKELKMDCKENGMISLLLSMPLFNFHWCFTDVSELSISQLSNSTAVIISVLLPFIYLGWFSDLFVPFQFLLPLN